MNDDQIERLMNGLNEAERGLAAIEKVILELADKFGRRMFSADGLPASDKLRDARY